MTYALQEQTTIVDDSVLLTRGQPMNRYWRVEIRSCGANLTGGKLFINYGPIV